MQRNKTKKNFFLAFCIVLSVLLHLVFIYYVHNKTYYNNEDVFTRLEEEIRSPISNDSFISDESQVFSMPLVHSEVLKQEMIKGKELTPVNEENEQFNVDLKKEVNQQFHSLEVAFSIPETVEQFLESEKNSVVFPFEPYRFSDEVIAQLKSYDKQLPASELEVVNQSKRQYFLSEEKTQLFAISPLKKVESLNKTRFQNVQLTFSLPPSSDAELFQSLQKDLQVETIQIARPSITPSFVSLPSMSQMDTTSYADYFDLDVMYQKSPDGKGYIFAITVLPDPIHKFQRIPQCYYFIIDKSNGIQKQRFSMTKNAVISALSQLKEKDRFNIVTFDSKVDILSSEPLSNTNVMVRKAKSFLNYQKIGSFFNSTNLFSPLYLALHKLDDPDQINTIFYFSNGEDLDKFSNYKKIQEWTKSNRGRISLFTIAQMDDKNLSVLDLMSHLNKGKMTASATLRGTRRHLQKTMQSISYPIAKDISSTAISKNSNVQIQLLPEEDQLSHLYANKPYVIFGKINQLDDFLLFIQGRRKGHYFNIKKKISFNKAKEGFNELDKHWAVLQSYQQYKEFLSTGNPKHLQNAENLLKPHDLPRAFK